ncbi:MAG: twin-arginine translocation signal domain-containing protein, partial [Planctomycetes bacterium]|nr:twin-arginine translocation signal domain-containing protein [Planctomycetota bacterium]
MLNRRTFIKASGLGVLAGVLPSVLDAALQEKPDEA